MIGIRLKKITKDAPDVIKEKVTCFCNVRRCLTRSTRKLFDKKVNKLIEGKSLLFACELVDNLHHYLGIPEEVFRYDAEPCVIRAGIQTLKEKLSSEEPAFISEEPFPVYGPEPLPKVGKTCRVIEDALERKNALEEETCQK